MAVKTACQGIDILMPYRYNNIIKERSQLTVAPSQIKWNDR